MKYKISDFTLDEKLALLTGKTGGRTSDANGKLPEVVMSDGPHGMRRGFLSATAGTRL